MKLHRVLRDVQGLGYLPVAKAVPKKGKDLDFSRGQIVGVRLDVIAGKMIFIPDREPLEHGTQGRKNGRVAGFGMKNSPARTRLEADLGAENDERLGEIERIVVGSHFTQYHLVGCRGGRGPIQEFGHSKLVRPEQRGQSPLGLTGPGSHHDKG